MIKSKVSVVFHTVSLEFRLSWLSSVLSRFLALESAMTCSMVRRSRLFSLGTGTVIQ